MATRPHTQLTRRRFATFVAGPSLLICLMLSPAVQSDDSTSEDIDSARARDMVRQRTELFALVASKGGFQAWHKSLEPFREDLRERLASITDSELYFGADNRVFDSGHILEYFYGPWTEFRWNSSEEFSSHPGPVVADFSDQLRARGIDLIFMPIPKVEEIYPETMSPSAPTDRKVSPARCELLLALLASGTEVIDLLPAYLRAREESGDNLYFYRDPHWSSHGIRIAARAVADRLARYPMVREAAARSPRYRAEWVDYRRKGAMLLFMTDKERAGLQPLPYKLSTVLDEVGHAFRETPGASILILGDSNVSGMRRAEDHLDRLSAHIALETNLPVETLRMDAGFSTMNMNLARKGSDFLEGRRVIIWTGDSVALSRLEWRAVKLP